MVNWNVNHRNFAKLFFFVLLSTAIDALQADSVDDYLVNLYVFIGKYIPGCEKNSRVKISHISVGGNLSQGSIEKMSELTERELRRQRKQQASDHANNWSKVKQVRWLCGKNTDKVREKCHKKMQACKDRLNEFKGYYKNQIESKKVVGAADSGTKTSSRFQNIRG